MAKSLLYFPKTREITTRNTKQVLFGGRGYPLVLSLVLGYPLVLPGGDTSLVLYGVPDPSPHPHQLPLGRTWTGPGNIQPLPPPGGQTNKLKTVPSRTLQIRAVKMMTIRYDFTSLCFERCCELS